MWNTADGYSSHVIYSDPIFDIVIERIQMAANDKGGKAIVRISDFDMYLPEGDVEELGIQIISENELIKQYIS